jgi:hypothetical protein
MCFMKWVTWNGVGVDRMACAWLITGDLDPQAEILFMPDGAEPFDISGKRLPHCQGHCTFPSMLRENDLPDPVL